MKLPDVNLLAYAHDTGSPFHRKAREWLEKALTDGSESVAISDYVSLSFIRLMCNPKSCFTPLTIRQACEIVDSWFEAGAIVIEAHPGHFLQVAWLMEIAHGGLNLIPDAHLAALAIAHRATVYSNDRDFLRFPGLKLQNPVG